MDAGAPEDLKRIWRQDELPVVVRKGAGYPLQVKLPHPRNDFEWTTSARRWLRAPHPRGRIPEWRQNYRGWEVPKAWFNDLVERLLARYGRLYVVQPYREQEKCAPACMNAVGHECQCSCMGANHGAGGPSAGWFTVSETFSTRWGEEHLACRLMTKA
jgi:hypothetical protein